MTRVPVVRARGATWKVSASALRRSGDALSKVEQLTFGEDFNDDMGGVVWPGRLRVVQFGSLFNQPIHTLAWPSWITSISYILEGFRLADRQCVVASIFGTAGVLWRFQPTTRSGVAFVAADSDILL